MPLYNPRTALTSLDITGALEATDSLMVRESGSDTPRWLVNGDGKLEWAASDGAPTNNLYRTFDNQLATDQDLSVGGGLAVTGAITAATVTTTRQYPWLPTDHGLKAWTLDPAIVGSNSTPTDGVLQLARVHLPVAATITNVLLAVVTPGTSLTALQNIAALYTAAGAKVDVTADQSGTWNSAGTKTMALAAGPYAAAAGDYYVAWWVNGGGTDPAFLRGNNQSAVNIGLSAPNLRFATADTGLTNAASAPLTFGAQTVANVGWWAGLS